MLHHICRIAHLSPQTQLIFIDMKNNDKARYCQGYQWYTIQLHLNMSTLLLILKQHYLRNFEREAFCGLNPLKNSLPEKH